MASVVVGITTGYRYKEEEVVDLPRRYIEAVERVGGVPVTLAPLREESLVPYYAQRLDALVVSGGRDIPPSLYGEEPIEATDALPEERPLFEIRLILQMLRLNKPVLGICYGCQLLNVAFGGSLIQDIPSQVPTAVPHRRPVASEPHARHLVYLHEGTRLAQILDGEQIEVVSSHHQAVKRLGEGMRVAAVAPDGIVEAIEKEGAHFCIGVQWHPELDPCSTWTNRLMKAFVEACV